jgi:hypothetical protein
MIQPGIWTDEGFLSLSIAARLMFIGMISGADDEGRGLATDRCLKASVFPADDVTLEQVRTYRDEVAAAVNVKLYDVDGKKYYECSKWRNHQRLERPSKSIIPAPPDDARKDTGTIPESSGTLPAELKKEVKEEKEGNTAPKRSTASAPAISFDFTTSLWDNIPDDLVERWQAAYPAANVERELIKAGEWLTANPKKRKSNYRAFLVNWLARCQERGRG